jgi:dihydrofolate reductase
MSMATPVTGPGLELVAALARNGVIGRDHGLPWRLPADLKHFRRLTWGHPVLMGRRTWDSIGRPLPGRRNLVLTRDPAWRADGATAVDSVDAARALAGPASTLMVIGGAEVYRLCLPLAERLRLTLIEAEIEGDVRFPEWRAEEWTELERESHPADSEHRWAYSFVTLERRPR